jgi:hypothetical protein
MSYATYDSAITFISDELKSKWEAGQNILMNTSRNFATEARNPSVRLAGPSFQPYTLVRVLSFDYDTRSLFFKQKTLLNHRTVF